MNYSQTLEYIHSLGKFSLPAGLDRIKAVLNVLGNPQNCFKSIHIAGTNGKGSVTVMTASALAAAGYKTGMFVSPYIIDFCERIQINGEFISENDLCRISEKVIETKIKLCEFEFITAVAFLYFAEQNVDVAVVETGLGGRLDATNALGNVLVSAITKIGFDHTAVLGDTIEQIAAEKCGIIKKGKTISAPGQNKKALEVIKRYAPDVIIPNMSDVINIYCDASGNTFIYKDIEYKTGLSGTFQIENAVTSLEILFNCGLTICDAAIKEGLKNAFIPARAEMICKSPIVVLDGAHNPDGAAVLSDIMRRHSDITAIIGVMQDKDYKNVLKQTLPLCKKVICVKAANMPRALEAELLSMKAKKYCDNVEVARSYSHALSLVTKDETLFVFGSLYLASGIRGLLKDTYK